MESLFWFELLPKKSKKDIKYKCHALCIQAEAVFGGKLFLFLRYFVLLGFVGWVGEHVSQKGSFGCSVNFYDSSSSWESILRSDSLFPRLAVAGCARALALVHRGGLLLGRHPRQGHQRHQTHQTATSGSAGLRGWLGNTIGGRVKFSATPFWGPATLFPPRSTSKTHFRIVDSSRLNPSRVDVLLRGRWLHWAPGGRSSRRRRRAGAPAAAVFDPGRVRGAGGTERPPAPLPAGAHQLSHPTLMRGNGIWSWLPTNWHQLEKLNAFAPI